MLSLIAAAVGGSASERAGSGEKERPWSLRELARPPVSADSGGWSQNAVDGFVAARLADAGESPADAAERAVWLRRLSFDLTGLPPNPAEVDRFGEDGSPDAAERQVDRLLASPRYGERMARHWMDVARYAETLTTTRMRSGRTPVPYRDYLIRAFNIDLPYAQFVREQIAGDVLYRAIRGRRWRPRSSPAGRGIPARRWGSKTGRWTRRSRNTSTATKCWRRRWRRSTA
ncbi:MAG: DUF1549 domain-containing protein [Verrucomicrobiales bacterium]